MPQLVGRKKAQKAQKVLTTNGHETHELKAERSVPDGPPEQKHSTFKNVKLET
jgi:hypothetical protein